MSDLKLTPSLLAILERIERHSEELLMIAVTASGGQDGNLNKLRGVGYVVKCDHPSVTEGTWPAETLGSPKLGGRRLLSTVPKSPRKRGGIVQATNGAYFVVTASVTLSSSATTSAPRGRSLKVSGSAL